MARPMTDIATLPPGRKSSYDYDDLIRSGHGELFGPENGRSAAAAHADARSRHAHFSGGRRLRQGRAQAELDIKPDLWFFDCHFEGDPVMPGCLGLDAMWQLVGFLPGLGRPSRAAAGRWASAR